MLLETVAGEFFKKHGQFPVPVHGRVFLFESGATVDTGGYQLAYYDPPENLALRLKARKDYQTIRLKMVGEAFAKLKSALLGGPQYYWDPQQFGPQPVSEDSYRDPQGGQAGLNRLKQLHGEHQDALAKVEAEMANLPEIKAAREALERDARVRADQQARENARRAEVEAIEL